MIGDHSWEWCGPAPLRQPQPRPGPGSPVRACTARRPGPSDPEPCCQGTPAHHASPPNPSAARRWYGPVPPTSPARPWPGCGRVDGPRPGGSPQQPPLSRACGARRACCVPGRARAWSLPRSSSIREPVPSWWARPSRDEPH